MPVILEVRHRASQSSGDDATVSRLTWEQTTAERDRLRGARAFFARQLGPLPAFAGISVALVSAFSGEVREEAWLVVAFVLFGLMVGVSIAYSRMPPYRQLRANRLRNGVGEGRGSSTPSDWYEAEIKLERNIYGARSARNRGSWWWWPRQDPGGDLHDQMEKERFGVFLTQALFVMMIVSLVFARLGP
jgi:hypothetical protein